MPRPSCLVLSHGGWWKLSSTCIEVNYSAMWELIWKIHLWMMNIKGSHYSNFYQVWTILATFWYMAKTSSYFMTYILDSHWRISRRWLMVASQLHFCLLSWSLQGEELLRELDDRGTNIRIHLDWSPSQKTGIGKSL